MNYDYVLHGLHLSMFTGKARAYLNYKQLNYLDKNMDAFTIFVKGKKKTGVRVMPLLETKSGEWYQDTTLIIEELERRHPEYPTTVYSPKQYIASLILETWADEWWVPIAMHYRWSYPENRQLFIDEAGNGLLPWAPAFIKNRAANIIANGLDGARPVIGFKSSQHAMIESWSENMLDLLEIHFTHHDYLLGGRPTIADYGLIASFYGHLDRDPAPKRILLDVRPKLRAWVERTHGGSSSTGELLENDEVPETLQPILDCVFNEFIPMIEAYADDLKQYVQTKNLKSGDKVKRILKPARFPMGEGTFERHTMPYTLWMMQRVQKKCEELSHVKQKEVDDWFQENCGQKLTSLDLGPRLEREGLATRLA